MDNQFVNSHRTRLTHNTFWSLSLYGISCDVHYHIGSLPWIQTLYQIALLFSAACDNLSAIIPSQILAHRIQKAYWMICGRIFCFPKPNVAASIFKNILLSRPFWHGLYKYIWSRLFSIPSVPGVSLSLFLHRFGKFTFGNVSLSLISSLLDGLPAVSSSPLFHYHSAGCALGVHVSFSTKAFEVATFTFNDNFLRIVP